MSLYYASAAYQVELTKKTLQLNVCIIPSAGKICVMGIYAFLSSASSITPSKNICEKFLNGLSVTTSIYTSFQQHYIAKTSCLKQTKSLFNDKALSEKKKQFKLLIVFLCKNMCNLGGPGMDRSKPDAAGSYSWGACSQSMEGEIVFVVEFTGF